MEKNYESYEFLASTNSDSDSNQFFVLQEDGTILSVNKEVQYITKADNEKDVPVNLNPTEGCPQVFDVPTQQYYVEFEGNTELISLNDQFVITNGDNNVISYNTNNYVIQPETTLTIEQMETETFIDPLTLDAQQLQQLNVEEYNGSKQTTDLAEITLSDEQYQVLEQKGWLLLESNDKIFVLNTLGLHDITSNDKLIQRLKNELQENTDTNSSPGQLKIESISSILPKESTEVTQEEGNVVEYPIDNRIPTRPSGAGGSIRYIFDNNMEGENSENTLKQTPEASETNVVAEVPVTYKFWNTPDLSNEAQKECDTLKIKTKYVFKEIPEKIYLGKTVNGKKLYAKVKKKSNKIHKKNINIKPHYNSTFLDAAIFTNLIQESFRYLSKPSPKQVTYAQAVVSQILRVPLPNIKHSMVGHNLVITNLITSYSDKGKKVSQPSMVTGTVQPVNGVDTFIHSPLMLLELLNEAEEKSRPSADFSCPEEKTARDLVKLFHIHITETKYSDKPPETTINLCERKLPLDVLYDAKKRHPNPVYACGTCGALFTSEMQLKDHQDDDIEEVEDELTIDTDDQSDTSTSYTVEQNGKEKLYTCTLCDMKFSRLFNCKKHVTAHKAGMEKKLKTYKCKMCSHTYFHSCSLSKHIVKTHIHMKSN